MTTTPPIPSADTCKIVATIEKELAFIHGFAVAIEYQMRGHGRQVYEKWESELPKHVRLVVLNPIPSSIGFWRKMGFTDFKAILPGYLVKPVNGHYDLGDLVVKVDSIDESDLRCNAGLKEFLS